MKITRDEVFQAADILSKQKVNPTIERVRAHLGFRGSNSTIVKYLSQWKESVPANGKIEIIVDDNMDIVAHLEAALNYQQVVWDSAEKALLAALRSHKLMATLMIKFLNKTETQK